MPNYISGSDSGWASMQNLDTQLKSTDDSVTSHTHGVGDTVLALCADAVSLGTGATDGETKITYDEYANKYTWDDDNSNWRVHTGNAYATAHLPASDDYTIPTGTLVWDVTTGYAKIWSGSAWQGIGIDQGVISWDPTNYTPDSSPTEAVDADSLTAHLKGIDNYFNNVLGQFKNNLMIEAFHRLIGDSTAGATYMQDGWTDTLQDESNVDTGSCENQHYDSSYYYEPEARAAYNDGAIGLTTVKMYDGVKEHAGNSFPLSSSEILIGCAFNCNIVGTPPSGNVTAYLYAADIGGLPTGSVLATSTPIDIGSISAGWNTFTFTSSYSASAGNYAIVLEYNTAGSDTDNCLAIYQRTSATYDSGRSFYANDGITYALMASPTYGFYFRVYHPTPNMTLVFNSYEAESEPDSSRVVIGMVEVDSITLNTDIKAWVSLDDGSNYDQVTLSDVGDFMASNILLAGEATFTGSGDETTVVKITTHNNKDLQIHAIGNLLRLE